MIRGGQKVLFWTWDRLAEQIFRTSYTLHRARGLSKPLKTHPWVGSDKLG